MCGYSWKQFFFQIPYIWVFLKMKNKFQIPNMWLFFQNKKSYSKFLIFGYL